MIYLKTPDEIQLVKAAADLTSRTLGEVARWIEPGVTTRKLDTIAREFIQDNGGRPACLGYEGFPGTLCIEVNDVVVHGFPSNYALREGDIVGTDLVVELNGFMGDSCYTFPVGEVDPKVLDLCRTTKESSSRQCICNEPMINMGSRNITIDRDGWTCRTRDHKPTAHYEHTLAIADDEPLVLTTFDYIKEVLQDRFI